MLRINLKILALCFCFAIQRFVLAQNHFPFQDPDAPTELRITNVLSLLTLQEKIDLLGTSLNVPRLGIHGSGAIDSIPGSSGQFEGLHGLAVGGPNHWGNRSPGAPGPQGGTSTIPTTQFPQPSGLGETWDPALLQKAATEEAYEARYIFQRMNRGGLIIRAPNADLARDPRWGRAEESYGEDPYLVGTMSAAYVKGLQGDDPHYWLAASLVKHFLANSNEDNRVGSSSNFDDRLLHEYYTVPFRMAIEQGGSNALMTAYNAVNGVPMAASPLINEFARQWGFNGIVDTDRGALDFMVTKHKYYPDNVTAAAGAIHAGINQFLNAYQDAVKSALQRHLISEGDIDRNLRGLFRVLIRLGFLDPPSRVPYTHIGQDGNKAPWDQETSMALALHLTQESIVLLKNSQNLLPLSSSTLKSIAVLGPSANVVSLDGYSGTPPLAITPLQGIRDKLNSRIDVRYSADDDAAIQLAKTSDVAVVVLGNRPMCHRDKDTLPCPDVTEGQEGIDRKEINLKPEQQQLVEKVYAANPRTIVVLVSSFPYAIAWEKQHIPAILHLANNSEEEGNALADVLFGNYNPAGRLSVTWPASIDQLPPMMDYNLRNGRTYTYFRGEPLFPFGYGLSYTTFSYSRLRLSTSTLSPTRSAEVSVEIKNTGRVPGDEVVQMYVKHLHSKVSRPNLELEGFQRVSLPAGKSKVVKIALNPDSLRYWNSAAKQWAVEKDQVQILIGSSSRDIKLSKKVNVRP